MPVLTMLIGIPGSGKSTYCANFLKQFPQTVYLSSDAMRLKLFGNEEYQASNTEVFDAMEAAAKQALREGKDVLLDATNLLARNRKNTLDFVKAIPGANAKAVVFKVPLKVCLERNRNRSRVVPESVIRRMRRQMELPSTQEGFQQIRWIYN